MLIGINALFWIPDAMGGTQTYFMNLLRALLGLDSANNYLVFVNTDGAKNIRIESPNLRIKVCPIPGRRRSLRLLWENLYLPIIARRCRVNLLHSLGYMSPLALSIPSVITVMDMIHYLYPAEIERSKKIIWKALFPASLRRADQVISISESVKRDLTRFFPWAESKTTCIPLGVNQALFKPAVPSEKISIEDDRVGQIILAVGSLSPHKNLGTLIRAFAQVQRVVPGLQLALVGMDTSYSPALKELAQRLSLDAHVRFLGRLSDPELIRLYHAAAVFVFPSLYEGFGLPPLEAMACGCPVIASNRSSIPEVCGDAALLFDPDDVSQLVSALKEVLISAKTRARLRRRGLEHAATYTWETTAARTLALYRHCHLAAQKPHPGGSGKDG